MQRKTTEPTKSPAQLANENTEKRNSVEQPQSIDKVRMLFPEDVEARLTFEVKGAYVIVRPIQFLGSEMFAKISATIRANGGEYISAGKESHWRVPI